VTLSVASVTVAYNAVSSIPRQMEALLGQTRPLQEIVVVDNASVDGTSVLLAERYPQVTVLKMSENVGAAGAWSAGLAHAALKKRHDWVWTFDDDSVPNVDALHSLVNAVETLGTTDGVIGMVAPLPVHRETGTSYPPLLWREGFVTPSAELLSQQIWFADLVILSGCMVLRDVVEKIGLPRSDFFMDFFDFEYCLRARSHGYKIAVITQAKVAHEIGSPRRFKLLGHEAIWTDHSPWRHYYMARNEVFTIWSYYAGWGPKYSVLRRLFQRASRLLLYGKQKTACLKMMFLGIVDGRRGRLGVRFLDEARSSPRVHRSLDPSTNRSDDGGFVENKGAKDILGVPVSTQPGKTIT
jgi:GT2 family glycosyltransferase